MRSAQREPPRLFGKRQEELKLSGPALLDLMQAVLAKGAPFRFKARGWSMEPFIRDGDVITVSPLGTAVPGAGDVVAFVRPGQGILVVHRVVARRGRTLIIQGDNVQDGTDGLVPIKNLLGRVTRVERSKRPVWLGLGPERHLIAWLSRSRLLIPLRGRLMAWLTALHRGRDEYI